MVIFYSFLYVYQRVAFFDPWRVKVSTKSTRSPFSAHAAHLPQRGARAPGNAWHPRSDGYGAEPIESGGIDQWSFQEPKLEVPTIYKAFIRPM